MLIGWNVQFVRWKIVRVSNSSTKCNVFFFIPWSTFARFQFDFGSGIIVHVVFVDVMVSDITIG